MRHCKAIVHKLYACTYFLRSSILGSRMHTRVRASRQGVGLPAARPRERGERWAVSSGDTVRWPPRRAELVCREGRIRWHRKCFKSTKWQLILNTCHSSQQGVGVNESSERRRMRVRCTWAGSRMCLRREAPSCTLCLKGAQSVNLVAASHRRAAHQSGLMALGC